MEERVSPLDTVPWAPDPEPDAEAERTPFDDFVVERERRADGRLVLYYGWPGESTEAAPTGARPTAAERPASRHAPRSIPWSPETEPIPTEEPTDV